MLKRNAEESWMCYADKGLRNKEETRLPKLESPQRMAKEHYARRKQVLTKLLDKKKRSMASVSCFSPQFVHAEGKAANQDTKRFEFELDKLLAKIKGQKRERSIYASATNL